MSQRADRSVYPASNFDVSPGLIGLHQRLSRAAIADFGTPPFETACPVHGTPTESACIGI
jgi:hypothetical protein